MGFSAKDVSEIASDDGVSTLLSHSTLRVSSMKHRASCVGCMSRRPCHPHPTLRLRSVRGCRTSRMRLGESNKSSLRCLPGHALALPASRFAPHRMSREPCSLTTSLCDITRTRNGPRKSNSTRASRRTSSRSCRRCSGPAAWRLTMTMRSLKTTTRTSRATPSRPWTCGYVSFAL